MPVKAFRGGDTTTFSDGGNSAIVGAFGALKVAEARPQISQLFSRPPDLQAGVYVGGTYQFQYNRSLLKVSGDAGGTSFVQTKKNLRYITAQTIEFNFTAAWSKVPSPADYAIMGGFDDEEGVYVGFVGENFVVGYRNTAVGADTTAIVDVSNLVTLGNLSRFRIRFGYLGIGNITYEVYLGGKYHLLHTFETDGNLFERTHVGVAILPMRGEVGSTDATLYMMSGSWGGATYGPADSFERNFFNDGTRLVNPSVGTQLPIVAYRSKATFGGYINRIQSKLTACQFATTNEGVYRVNFLAYPAGTLTTGTWNNVSPYSVLEYNSTSTGVPAGSTKIFSTIITVAGTASGNSSSVTYDFEKLQLIANPTDEFLITLECVVDKGGSNTETLWSINYQDLF